MNANLSFQEQLDAITAQGRRNLPADLSRSLLDSLKRLLTSDAKDRALKEGEQAPDFTLLDARGGTVTLSQLLKEGPVVVTFYRGEWCPYCNLQLHAYQQVLPQLQALGASLVAISPQRPDHSLSLVEKRGLTFAILSDVGNQVARAYRLVFTLDENARTAYQQMGANLPRYNGDTSWELPIPGTFLVDQSGSVRLAFVDPDFTHRLDPSLIIDELKNLEAK